jgi:FkbM family methyltransferase
MTRSPTRLPGSAAYHRAIVAAKKILYGRRGEPITLGNHTLRYVPGTRPVRLRHANSPDETVRNDVRQIQYYLANVKPGEFLVDVGSNAGQYTVLFASLCGEGGRVIAFEPGAAARELLKENLALNGFENRVQIEAYALSDIAGRHVFYERGADAMASLERAGFGGDSSASDIEERMVETIALDDYLAERGLGTPNLVKIDTEGAEVKVLRGAVETLRGQSRIICELHPYAWSAFGSSYSELLEIVGLAGRSIRYLDTERRIDDGPVYGAVVID